MQLPAYEREWHGVGLASLAPGGAASLPDHYAAIYRQAAVVKADNSSWRSSKLRLAGLVGDLLRDHVLAPPSAIDLLSLGAGTGVMEEAWVEAGFKVAVQECQPFSLAEFQGNHPAVPVFIGSADAVAAPAGSFDAVVLCAIDYVFPAAEYVRVLKETQRLLRPGGIAVVVSVSHLCAGSFLRTAARAAIEKAAGKLGPRSRRVFWGWKRTAGEHVRAGAAAGLQLTRLCVYNEAGVRDTGALAADLTTGPHDLLLVWTRP